MKKCECKILPCFHLPGEASPKPITKSMDNEITINGEVYVKKICNHHGIVLCKNCPNYDEIKDLEVSKPWPQEGDEYWYVGATGDLIRNTFMKCNLAPLDLKKIGNFFKTREEAQMYSLRLESLSKGKLSLGPPSFISPDDTKDYYSRIFINFPTKEECQEWYDTYGHAWTYLLDNNKK